jgi:hypothetical protein
MRFLLIAAIALLFGCTAPTTSPRYAAGELDAVAKRFEPPTGKARIYATTSLWRTCTYIGCVNARHPIAASVHVNLQYAGDLTNLDHFVFVDVDPGDVDLYFTEPGTTHKPLAGARARIRAEEGGVYFYRLSGGNASVKISNVLSAGATAKQFTVELLSEAGRQHITEKRLVGFPETRLAEGTQPSTSLSNPVSVNPVGLAGRRQHSTSSSDPVGDAAETAGRVTRFALETAFYLALGAASAPPRGSYSGGNWGDPRGASNAELTMYCNPIQSGPILGTTECHCNSNNQHFTSIIVQGASCPIFIFYNVTNNTWRHR